MKEEQNRFLVAVILSGAILFSWQFFFAKPKAEIAKKEQESITKTTLAQQAPKVLIDDVTTKGDSEFTLSNKISTVTLSEKLEIISSQFEKISTKSLFKNENKISQINFTKDSGEQQLSFNVKETGLNSLLFQNSEITANISLDENGKLSFAFSNISNEIKGIVTYSYGTALKADGHQFSKYVYFKDSLVETTVEPKMETVKDLGRVQWSGFDYKYHLSGFSFPDSTKDSVFNITINSDSIKTTLPIQNSINFFFIKKTYDSLVKMGDNLHMAVDLGWFSFLAIPILRGLQYCYSIVPNYGWAIILLTLFIRLITSPLQFISSKSMKKMQKIQPELTKLREKYKDNPQKMQQESMALFKKTGANPMSGCFPLLLQMPIFFAFYKVLYGAVELMGAPFIGWIHDLSVKDPYYVLPVLVSIGMFLQQKIMPSTAADPTQQKVMMFLPLIFGFIMKDLPSGLNLYIFVSTIFGIFQQYVILKTVKV